MQQAAPHAPSGRLCLPRASTPLTRGPAATDGQKKSSTRRTVQAEAAPHQSADAAASLSASATQHVAAAAVAASLLLPAAARADGGGGAADVFAFEPQFSPALLGAALFAAAPPILFWGRIFISAQRRDQQMRQEKQAEDQKQSEREELKRKLFGDK